MYFLMGEIRYFLVILLRIILIPIREPVATVPCKQVCNSDPVKFSQGYIVSLDLPDSFGVMPSIALRRSRNLTTWSKLQVQPTVYLHYRGINNNPPSIKNPLLIFWRILRIIKTPLNFFGAQIFRIIKTPLIGAKRRRKF